MWETLKEEINSFERRRGGKEKNFEAAFQEMRQIKKKQMLGLFYAFSLFRVALDEYKRTRPESISLRSFIDDLQKKQHPHLSYLSDLAMSLQTGKTELYIKTCPSTFKNFLDEDKVVNCFEEMLKPNYRAPKDQSELHLHLWTLLVYCYLPFKARPLISELKVDSAMSLLSFTVGSFTKLTSDQVRKLHKIRPLHKKVSEKKRSRQEEVRRHFEQMDTKGLKPYTIASKINEKLGNKWSDRQIRDDLKELHLC